MALYTVQSYGSMKNQKRLFCSVVLTEGEKSTRSICSTNEIKFRIDALKKSLFYKNMAKNYATEFFGIFLFSLFFLFEKGVILESQNKDL